MRPFGLSMAFILDISTNFMLIFPRWESNMEIHGQFMFSLISNLNKQKLTQSYSHIMKTKATTITVSGAICALILTTRCAQAQNLFATYNNQIDEFTPAGVESEFASDVNGNGLAFAPNGNLFVATYTTITEYTPGGTESTFATGAGSSTQMAFNSTDDLFQVDHSGNIFEYTPSGAQTTFVEGLSQPEGIAFNSAGDLFVSGGNLEGYIYEYTPSGVQSTFTTAVSNPLGLAFNSVGDLFEADADSGNIYEFTPGGVRSTFATGLPNVTALAFNTTGDLFASSGDNIYEFTPSGTKSTFATGTGAYGLAFEGETLPVPEPSTCALAGVGAALCLWRRRK
jgi:PEP-CTERM motif